jgi:2-oxoglutarate dehydrogenase E1 component
MSPKSLLRHKLCVSPATELELGSFSEILDDPRDGAERARRLVLCSGKLYYDLLEGLEQLEHPEDVALVRVEQFYPFREELMHQVAERHSGAEQLIWAQEEPQNRGGWSFMSPRLEQSFPGLKPRYVGRQASASPAVGSLRVHREQQRRLVERALTG